MMRELFLKLILKLSDDFDLYISNPHEPLL